VIAQAAPPRNVRRVVQIMCNSEEVNLPATRGRKTIVLHNPTADARLNRKRPSMPPRGDDASNQYTAAIRR
jgi:hypothetical protein